MKALFFSSFTVSCWRRLVPLSKKVYLSLWFSIILFISCCSFTSTVFRSALASNFSACSISNKLFVVYRLNRLLWLCAINAVICLNSKIKFSDSWLFDKWMDNRFGLFLIYSWILCRSWPKFICDKFRCTRFWFCLMKWARLVQNYSSSPITGSATFCLCLGLLFEPWPFLSKGCLTGGCGSTWLMLGASLISKIWSWSRLSTKFLLKFKFVMNRFSCRNPESFTSYLELKPQSEKSTNCRVVRLWLPSAKCSKCEKTCGWLRLRDDSFTFFRFLNPSMI